MRHHNGYYVCEICGTEWWFESSARTCESFGPLKHDKYVAVGDEVRIIKDRNQTGKVIGRVLTVKEIGIHCWKHEEETCNTYLCTAVDGEWLNGFMCGNRDLRDTVVNAASKEYLLLKNSVPEFDPVKCTPVDLTDELVPEPGFKVDFEQMQKDDNASAQSDGDDN